MIDNADYSIINFNYGTVLPLPVTEPNTLTASSAFDPGSIRLQWLPPANETISGFRIWRSTDGVNYEQLPDVLPATATQWDDNSLADGVKCTYRVRAFKTLANGATEYSPGTNKASAVTNLPGPIWITASNFTEDAVTLNWTDRANGEAAYRIEVANSPGDWQLLTTMPGQSGSDGDMSYTASGLNPLGFAEFRVMAMTAAADSARSTGWRNVADNTTVLKLKDPAFNGLFSPSPLESDGTTLRSLGGDETITANFTAPRHTKLNIGFRVGVGGTEGVDRSFIVKLDGIAIFTESWTNWRQDEWGDWQCDFSRVYGTDVQPLNNGPDPSTGPDPVWILRVKHTSGQGVLSFETTGLTGEDAWTVQSVGVVATLPYVSGIGALNGGEPAQNGLFYLRASVNDEIFNVQTEFSGTAASGLDYVPIPLQKEFNASSGDPTMYIPVVVKDDPFSEGGESVIMTIVSGAGYAPGSWVQGGGSDSSVVWIGDDEQPPPPPPPPPVVSIAKLSDGSEDPDPARPLDGPKPATFVVTRTATDISQPIEVTYRFIPGNATEDDVTTSGGSVVIPANETSAEFEVDVVDDTEVELVAEDFEVELETISDPEYVFSPQPARVGAVIQDNELTISVTVIDGAVSISDVFKRWATVKAAGEFVIVEASLDREISPERQAQIQWEGGEPVEGQPLKRKVSKAESKRTTVKATIGDASDVLDVWVIWADLSIKMNQSETISAGNNSFAGGLGWGVGYGGGSSLGEIDRYQNPAFQYAYAGGKVEIEATLTPPGVSSYLPSNAWDFLRGRSGIGFINGQLAWERGATEISNSYAKDLDPQSGISNDQIYDLDIPAVPAEGEMFHTAETYVNFTQWATVKLGGVTIKCSDGLLWGYRAQADDDAQKMDANDLYLGSIALPGPGQSFYMPR